MPITQSAKKALRQTVRRRARNIAKKEAVKKAVKQYKKSLAEKKSEQASQHLALVYKALDKAAKTNVIKKNKAARLKSRLSSLFAKVK